MHCFSTKLPETKFTQLKTLLSEQGFTFAMPQYTLFQAKKPGISVTLYASGKLTVQGKNKDGFIEFYLEPYILESVEYTNPSARLDFTARIGVDEAGKGDFFGPLCTAAVHADEERIKQLAKLGIQDSKTLSDRKALELDGKIRSLCVVEVLRLFPEKYNELYDKFNNLNKLLAWCHATVIDAAYKKTGCTKATIDQFGGKWLVESALSRKNEMIELTQRHRGEEDIVVAAASIIARAAFLNGLKQLENAAGITLPKGASSSVKSAAKRLAGKDPALLLGLCKKHFKTYNEVLGD